MGLFGNIFSQAAGANPPENKPPQRGPQKRDPHRDNRPEQDKEALRKHHEKEADKATGQGNGGEQKDGKLW